MSAPKTKFLVLSSVNNNVIHLETISILTTAANAVLGLFLARLAVASSLQPKKKSTVIFARIFTEHSARSNVSYIGAAGNNFSDSFQQQKSTEKEFFF